MDEVKPFAVGDVIQLKGASVPPELWPCFWRVLGLSPHGTTELSRPFVDADCRVPYRAEPPARDRCGKRVYVSQKQARLANRKAHWRVRTYFCPLCTGYHTTNAEKEERW